MKKLFIIGILTCLPLITMAQKKWALGLSSSFDITGVFVSDKDYLKVHTLSGVASYSSLIHAHYFVTPQFFVKIGIGFYESGYYQKTALIDYYTNDGGFFYVKSSSKYLECPILFGWNSKSKNKVHFYGTLGPSFRLFMAENYLLWDNNSSNSYNKTIGQMYNKGSYLFGLDGILTAGISIDLSPNLSLLIENAMRVNIVSNIGYKSPVSDPLFRQWGEGLKVGVIYRIGKSG